MVIPETAVTPDRGRQTLLRMGFETFWFDVYTNQTERMYVNLPKPSFRAAAGGKEGVIVVTEDEITPHSELREGDVRETFWWEVSRTIRISGVELSRKRELVDFAASNKLAVIIENDSNGWVSATLSATVKSAERSY